ncbi:MAG: primosomal protein N' [Oscillospiraceae bacterium]|jgi:primosomal protein N' (replication factor Y)|nr:primosomal protein N' [Oscillospiraceae bacterium]
MIAKEKIEGLTALVAVERALYSFDRLYSYVVPRELEGTVEAGKRVSVPFGRGSKKMNGMVFAVQRREYDPRNIKKIHEVLDAEPVMNAETLALTSWIKENTFCTYYNAVGCVLPPVLRDPEAAGRRLAGKTERIVRLSGESGDCPDNLTPKQKAVVTALENHSASVKELCYLCSVTPAVVTNLVKKGVLEEFAQPVPPPVPEGTKNAMNAGDIELTPAQNGVFAGLLELVKSGEPKCALLRGVTGSGKTSVFIKLIGEVLAMGKTAVALVPEISLTPQVIGIFTSYFGNAAAVIHSGLSMAKKTEEYGRLKSGEAKIAIGTRSAIFAPLENIGIIVIDEEGEHTYKSERSPRYHARDIAKQRCFRHNALLLLSSATPSMESYRKAKTGKYSLFELNERYSGNALPDVYVVDMKIEAALGNKGNFSEPLINELRANLERGEQSLILLNRRGYYTYMCCIACGEVSLCPSCGVPLTYHKPGDNLSCHYCGFIKPLSGGVFACGKCGSRFARKAGTGTQRAEDELSGLLPGARILRMDADTTMTKGAYERGFGSFGDREYDVMLGTQMIAKGLDFSNVTLVGVLLIDKSLYGGDYLGYERTFSLITQVVGRSGRGGKKGRAYLQTYTPEHYVLKLAARQDYAGFYEEEAAIRETLLFPPFCDLCVAEFSSAAEKTAAEAASVFAGIFGEELKKSEKPVPVRVLGPVKSGAGNPNGRFRYRLIIKCRNSAAFRGAMKESLIAANSDKRFEFTGIAAWFE